MSGIWMTFFFCPSVVSRYGVQSDVCMITLKTPVLNTIRTKHRPIVLSWAYGLMQRGPPG